ncbi:MAG TPA: hypothetical protein VH280_01025 [Verrucomicrobiae bacterium]|jgi:hypothetical protein|nr:hypothetical protein [Verrucomicrobiae bacterium]
MKTTGFHKPGAALAAALMAFSTAKILAQDTNAFGQYEMPPPNTPVETTPAAPPAASGPQLSSAESQVLQLSQAKISDGTIISYIQNSGTVYGLDASQIVYLKQQGVSEGVINAMLNQRSAMAAAAAQQQQQQPQQPQAPAPYDQTAVAQPSSPPPSTTYIVPDSQTVYYDNWAAPYWNYPAPAYYNTWSWGVPVYWGWGWHGGFHPGFHGGFGGGFHGGGGFHSSGGFHSGGGFGGGFHR